MHGTWLHVSLIVVAKAVVTNQKCTPSVFLFLPLDMVISVIYTKLNFHCFFAYVMCV